jgi:zinc protease
MIRMLAAFVACLAGTASDAAPQFPVAVHTLGNGMQILAHEDHDIPNVALYLFFRVGSRNERPGITGISHFLEHMMFNGSKEYGPRQFDLVMEKNGASNNAYTTRDVTVYSDWFSRSSLELVLSMEAERLGHLTFDPVMVESERKVVLSERRTTVENDNFGFLLERLYATLYRMHPYRWPVLGWVQDMRAWTVADLREYFRRGYAPNNCVMVAVGDIAADGFFQLVEKDFAALPRRELPPPAGPAEPEQRQERRVEVERPAHAPQQLIAFHVPPSAHPDYWPLQIASAVLTSGHSSRLYRRLVRRERLAVSVTSWQRLSLDPGELIISLDLKQHADITRADHALDEEMARLRTSLVSDRELRAAKNKILTDRAREIRTNSGKADWLGTYEVFFGDYRKLFSASREIERVSASDVQRVARTYFAAANRTVATLRPSPPSREPERAQ